MIIIFFFLVLPLPTISNFKDSISGEKDFVLNNGPLLINANNSTDVISTNFVEYGNNDFKSKLNCFIKLIKVVTLIFCIKIVIF